MTSAEKKQQKEWEKFAKETDKFISDFKEQRARTFKGLPDRLVNVLVTVVTTALILAASYLDFANFLIDIFPTNLFTTTNGVFDTAKNWGIIGAVLVGSTVLSTNKSRLPKFVKTITCRAGLVASVAVLISLPTYVEEGKMSRELMIAAAFGFILYSCFSSRSNMTNLSLGKSGLLAGTKIKGVKNLINAYREGKNNLAEIKKEFQDAEKKLSANAGGTSNLAILLWAIIITTGWMVCIEFMSVELVSAIAVLALTTALELIEAFKGPSENQTAGTTTTVSKEEMSSLYSQIKSLIPSVAK